MSQQYPFNKQKCLCSKGSFCDYECKDEDLQKKSKIQSIVILMIVSLIVAVIVLQFIK